MQQDWHFTIKGELIYGEKLLHLHPANFVNLIRISDYHNRIMPIILTRLQIDKNLLDYIVKHAETCQIKLTITKFMLSDDRLRRSIPEVMVDDIFQVSVGTDVNYNKELDYVEATMSEFPIQDKFKETYLGLISKSCLDANKLVANEVIKDSLIQDVVLSYLLSGGNLHPLVEPFDHNEKLEQTIVPPTDSLYSTIEYFNSLKVFYDSRFILFIDEPHVTYLISKSGKGVEMKDEKYNTVILSMRNAVESKNLTIGMSNDGVTQAYQADISVLDSYFQIDKDTPKVLTTIGSILNPDINLSKVKDDIVTQLKNALQQQKKSFITSVLSKSKAVGNVATKLSGIIPKMTHAVNMIQEATANLQTTVKQNVDKIISQLPAEIASVSNKSVLKSLMDSKFITCDVNLDLQQNVKSNFSQVIDSTANEHYKMDFLDNMASCVTYVNLPDISKATDSAIGALSSGVTKVVGEMASKVTSNMGGFANLTSTLGDMVGQLSSWESKLQALIAASSGSSGGSGSGSGGQNAQDAANAALLKAIQSEKSTLTIREGETDYYGGIADEAHGTGQDTQTNLSGYVSEFLKDVGSVGGSVDPSDIKAQFVSKAPPITFGNLDLGQIMTSTMGGCFGGGNSGSSGFSFGSLAGLDLNGIASKVSGGKISFSNLGELKLNLGKFDLGRIGTLGIGSIGFNLNLGTIPGIGEIAGTKLLKVRNDNPNELKNVKSEIELSKNRLTFNKLGLDPSVFTPNKRFLIKNYNAHENKDGVFILARRIEVYTREDESFICNTHLEFLKVAEEASGGKATNISAANPNAVG